MIELWLPDPLRQEKLQISCPCASQVDYTPAIGLIYLGCHKHCTCAEIILQSLCRYVVLPINFELMELMIQTNCLSGPIYKSSEQTHSFPNSLHWYYLLQVQIFPFGKTKQKKTTLYKIRVQTPYTRSMRNKKDLFLVHHIR